MKTRIMICAAAVLILAAGSARADFTNAGFETGDLTGWSAPAGGAVVTTLHNQQDGSGQLPSSWTPTEGQYFARLQTDGPGNWRTLEQSFSAAAGDVVSFDYFFDWGDYHNYDDQSYGRLLDANGALVNEFFHWGQGGTLMGANYSNVGWSSQSYALTAGGTYTLKFGICNDDDSVLDSYMGIDNTYVPVPGAVLLGMLGLSVVGVKLRKFA